MWKHTKVYGRNLKAVTTPATVIVNQGGTSSTKTWSILQLLHEACKVNDILVSVVSHTLPHLKKGAMKDYFDGLLRPNGLYSIDKHNRTDHIYEVGPGRMEFFSADNWDKVLGPRRDVLFVNEANKLPFETFDHLEVRTNRRTFIDFNPVRRFWAHEQYEGNPEAQWIKSTYKDALDVLPEKIVRGIEAKKNRPDWWRVFGLGEVGQVQGQIYTNWHKVDAIPEHCELIGAGMDFGFVNDPTALVQVYKGDGGLWLRQIIYQTGLTLDEIDVVARDRGYNPRTFCVADSTERLAITGLRGKGWNVHPANKAKGSVAAGIDILQGHTLRIEARSVDLIDELNNYTWKQDRISGEYLNQPDHKYSHGMDAIRYLASEKLGSPGTRSTGFAPARK